MLSQIGDSHCPEMTHCTREPLSDKKINLFVSLPLVELKLVPVGEVFANMYENRGCEYMMAFSLLTSCKA